MSSEPGTSYLEEIPLRVVSLQRLLALKRAADPPRDKDLFDIRASK
jgi:hypothetical protein